MRVLNAVTSLLSVLAHEVKSYPALSNPSSAVKRHGDPTLTPKPLPLPASPSASRIRGHKLLAIRAQHFRLYPLCVMCKAEGRVTIANQLDHIVALVNGGLDFDKDDGHNRQGLCEPHHLRKTAADMGHEYRERLEVGLDGWPLASPIGPMGPGTTILPIVVKPHDLSEKTVPVGGGGSKVGWSS